MEQQHVQLEQLDERYRELRLPRPEAQEAMRRSVERHGLLQPLVANRSAEGQLVLVDGFKRLRALKALAIDTAAVRVLSLSEEAAQAAILTCNAPTQGLSDLEQGWVVRSLVRGLGLSMTDAATLLGRHKSWVSRRLMLVERLDGQVQQDMRLGLLTATAGREVAQLPRGNQGPAVETIQRHGLSTRQVAGLVQRLLGCDDEEAAKALLSDPLRYLIDDSTGEVKRRDPRLSEGAEKLRRGLLQLDQGTVRAGQLLRRYRPMDLRDSDLVPLSALATPIEERLRDTHQRLRALLAAARSEPADA